MVAKSNFEISKQKLNSKNSKAYKVAAPVDPEGVVISTLPYIHVTIWTSIVLKGESIIVYGENATYHSLETHSLGRSNDQIQGCDHGSSSGKQVINHQHL